MNHSEMHRKVLPGVLSDFFVFPSFVCVSWAAMYCVRYFLCFLWHLCCVDVLISWAWICRSVGLRLDYEVRPNCINWTNWIHSPRKCSLARFQCPVERPAPSSSSWSVITSPVSKEAEAEIRVCRSGQVGRRHWAGKTRSTAIWHSFVIPSSLHCRIIWLDLRSGQK